MAIGPYLIVITKREKIGDVDGHTVWKVIDTEVLSFKRTLLHLTEQQVSERKNRPHLQFCMSHHRLCEQGG